VTVSGEEGCRGERVWLSVFKLGLKDLKRRLEPYSADCLRGVHRGLSACLLLSAVHL
jgi:hypothetical protein